MADSTESATKDRTKTSLPEQVDLEMRSKLAAVLFVLLAGAGMYLSLRSSPRPNAPEKPGPLAGLGSRPVSDLMAARQTTNPAATEAVTLAEAAAGTPNSISGSSLPVLTNSSPPDLPPATVLENMRTTFRQYAAMFGGNPVGTNLEITRALLGNNPKHINFIKADGNRVNSNGELVDWWGTPYFFHQLSGTEMEIRSAGPDRTMWTADDLVIR